MNNSVRTYLLPSLSEQKDFVCNEIMKVIDIVDIHNHIILSVIRLSDLLKLVV
jgi:hypothetical protein